MDTNNTGELELEDKKESEYGVAISLPYVASGFSESERFWYGRLSKRDGVREKFHLFFMNRNKSWHKKAYNMETF